MSMKDRTWDTKISILRWDTGSVVDPFPTPVALSLCSGHLSPVVHSVLSCLLSLANVKVIKCESV